MDDKNEALTAGAVQSEKAAAANATGQWRGSLAQVICDVPLPERNDKYQSGFVDAKQAILQALRDAGFDRAAATSAAGQDVLAERRRQVEQEGWTPEHDDKYSNCELARAAATYALCSHIEQLKLCGEQVWPWRSDWWKRGSYRRDLVKAGALILAEIDRVDRDRAAAKGTAGQEGGAQ